MLPAMAMKRALEGAGATVLGPHTNAADALAAVELGDVAILDIHLRGGDSFAVAKALTTAAVPFFFVTGYSDPPDLPPELADVKRFTKPLLPSSLRRAVQELIRSAERP